LLYALLIGGDLLLAFGLHPLLGAALSRHWAFLLLALTPLERSLTRAPTVLVAPHREGVTEPRGLLAH
jgi:hypothetical protein